MTSPSSLRIAILSDIHGNSLALDAVLADAAAVGVDGYWILGDLAALGPDPIGVLQRVSALPGLRCVRGNCDRYLVDGHRPPPSLPDVHANVAVHPELLDTFAEVTATFAWTQGAVQATGWLDWLAALPLELHESLPDGTQVLGVHATPGNDDGPSIHPGLTDNDLFQAMGDCSADLVFVGHSHFPLDRRVGRWRVFNPGSVSNPRPPDLRASYALLEANHQGYSLTHRRVEYDRQKVINTLQTMLYPGAKFIIDHLEGHFD